MQAREKEGDKSTPLVHGIKAKKRREGDEEKMIPLGPRMISGAHDRILQILNFRKTSKIL